MFSSISINDDANKDKINDILKQLYETRFFSDVNIKLENNILKIYLKENPIIENIIYDGIKAQKIRDPITKNLKLRNRSSYNEIDLNFDKEKIIFIKK